ncbi:hypothetical protein HAP94_11920 [Acidithiobacillus ferrivorans]|nr:hypothetical protein [Acidithiobacillus ferrivorans]
MNGLPITVVVAPYVNDIMAYKNRGYPWLYIRDMLVTAKVLSDEVKLLSFRRACITNLYASAVEQKLIPAAATAPTTPTRPQVAARPASSVQVDISKTEEKSADSPMLSKLAAKGIFFK